MNSSKRLINVGILTLCLSGCASTISSCPPITVYTVGQQEQAAKELDAAVQTGAIILPMMMGDYMVLRDQIRACRK